MERCNYCHEPVRKNNFRNHFLTVHFDPQTSAKCRLCDIEPVKNIVEHVAKEHPNNCQVCLKFVENPQHGNWSEIDICQCDKSDKMFFQFGMMLSMILKDVNKRKSV